jgi:hypothetical protein
MPNIRSLDLNPWRSLTLNLSLRSRLELQLV